MDMPDPTGSRAVLVGVSRYRQLEPLPAVANNLDALGELLTSSRAWNLPAANCVKVHNPTSTNVVLRQVHEAARAARSALLIYFAGHGLLDNGGELYLALTNGAPDRLYDAIRFAEIRRELIYAAARCPAKVVLIDSCFSGAAMTGFMGGSGTVADLAVVEGAYIMTASGTGAKARAPVGARYTAFTGALVETVRSGVPGGPAQLDMDTVYEQVALNLRSHSLPTPQRQRRNDGHRIVLAQNCAPHAATRKGRKQAAKPAFVPRATESSAKIAALPVPPKPAPAAKPARVASAAPGKPPVAATPVPRRRGSARATRRDIERARRAIRNALREQPLLPVQAVADVVIKEVPNIFESGWAGAGTCKLFLAKYLGDFPYTMNRTGGFVEAPPSFPHGVLAAVQRPIKQFRIRRLITAVTIIAVLGYTGRWLMSYVDGLGGDPTLTVVSPAEGRLTQSRYTIKVSAAAATGQRILVMVRQARTSNSGKWSFYPCTTSRRASQCANVPLGVKGSEVDSQVVVVAVTEAQGRRLLDAAATTFRGVPAALHPIATSKTYRYRW